MRGRTLTDTELLLELVGEAYSFEDLSEFRRGVLEILGRMVPCDSAGYNEVAPAETFAITIPQFDESLTVTFSKLAYENPLISRFQRTGDGRPYRISDMIDLRSFHRLALYREVYSKIGVERQVAFILPSRPSLIVGIVLCREARDFTDREVGLLGLARPHLMQAYRNAELASARAGMLVALEQGLDTLGRHVVVVDPQGRVEFATDGARRLLAQPGSGLPAPIRPWISSRRGPRAGSEPLLLSTSAGSVVVRLLPNRRSDGREVLLLEAGTGELDLAALGGLGLSRRQTEALRWIALGRSPAEAAVEMGIARRTVDKHLQHIYAKLGASGLSQASATAWAAVGVGHPGGDPSDRSADSRS